MAISFQGAQFPQDIILMDVRSNCFTPWPHNLSTDRGNCSFIAPLSQIRCV
jgi:hypothetical protein